MRYVATINVPGYLPMDDEPSTFDTAAEAWRFLAGERERAESDAELTGSPSSTLANLREYAEGKHYSDPQWPVAPDGTGVQYGETPGYDGGHDLGLAYSVSRVEKCRHSWVAGMCYVADDDLPTVSAVRPVECENCDAVYDHDNPDHRPKWM